MPAHIKALIVIFALGLLTYANGLRGPYMIDDHAFFELKSHTVSRALGLQGPRAEPYYRPLAAAVPAFSHFIFKDNTVGHHSLNLVLLCLAGWGIFLFMRHLGASYLAALLATVFYVIHPIHGVAVNYITASVFSLQVILMLGALYLHTPGGCVGCILFLFATFCHETALMLPFYAFILALPTHPPGVCRFRQAWKKTWPLFAVLGAIIVFRMFFSPLQEVILNKIIYFHMTLAQYLATWTKLLWWYLSRLVWPQDIVLIMAQQPLTSGIGLWLIVFVLLIATSGYLLWLCLRDKILFLGLSWFILGFAPFTLACLFQPVHGLIIEPHWFMFPAVGFFMVLGQALSKVLHKAAARISLTIFLFICIFSSYWHNRVWADEVRYCLFWLKESPAFTGINAYIAQAYKLRGQHDLARQYYAKVLDMKCCDAMVYADLSSMSLQEGVGAFRDGDYPKALEHFQKARDLNPKWALPHLDIAMVALKLQDQPQAIAALKQALAVVPNQEDSMVELMKIYLSAGDKPNIIETARHMLAFSQNPYTLQNAGILLRQYGYKTEAEEAFIKAKRIIYPP